jgi:hypothetical protein
LKPNQPNHSSPAPSTVIGVVRLQRSPFIRGPMMSDATAKA